MIAAANAWRSGLGNKVPSAFQPEEADLRAHVKTAPRCWAIFNATVLDFDYVARQKIAQAQHLNWFIVEQLPGRAAGAV